MAMSLVISDDVFDHVSTSAEVDVSDYCSNLTELKYFVDILAKNPNLTAVSFCNLQLGPDGVKCMSRLLSCPTLRSLDVSGNKGGSLGLTHLADALVKNANLETLFYADNASVGAEAVKSLCDSLSTHSRIRTLNLNGTNLRSDAAAILGGFLSANPPLEILNVCGNQIGLEGASAIAQSMTTNQNLQHLFLNMNRLGDVGVHALVGPTSGLRGNATLKTLGIGQNNIGPIGAEQIAQLIALNDSLISLDLSGNALGADGARLIGLSLARNTGLVKLNFRGNNLGSDGVRNLTEHLKSNHTLSTILLSGNSILTVGAKCVADLLKCPGCAIKSVELNYNSISDDGVGVICDALKSNSMVTSISLCGNGITAEGARKLAKVVKTSPSLKKLSLEDNQIGPKGAQHFLEVLKGSSTLIEELLLGNNEIPDDAMQTICLTLAKKKESACSSDNPASMAAPLPATPPNSSSGVLGASTAAKKRSFPWFSRSRGSIETTSLESQLREEAERLRRELEEIKAQTDKTTQRNKELEQNLDQLLAERKQVEDAVVQIRAAQEQLEEREEELIRREMYNKWLEADSFELRPDGLMIEDRPLAQGAFGSVHRGSYLKTPVAVKKMLAKFTGNQEATDDFAKEIQILKKVKHPNLVMCIGAITKEAEACIVLEYMEGGSLHSALYNRTHRLSGSQKLTMMLEVSKAMNYLHSLTPCPIIHRDLKLQNILLDRNLTAKVTDFGLSRTKQHSVVLTDHIAGTPAYMSPEVSADNIITEKCDVYSFGMILWELMTEVQPWKGKNAVQIARAVDKGERPAFPVGTPIALRNLISACWSQDPGRRPNFSYIIERLEMMIAATP